MKDTLTLVMVSDGIYKESDKGVAYTRVDTSQKTYSALICEINKLRERLARKDEKIKLMKQKINGF